MIFVDTSGWIALSDRRDQYHGDALAIYTKFKKRKQRLTTTTYVIDETITRLRYDLSHSIAIAFMDFIERAEETRVLSVLFIDQKLFQEAKKTFRKYNASKLSFADCTSFAVCQKYKISNAFAFDQHFAMMGIVLL